MTPIYVINLARSRERRNAMEHGLDRAGVAASFARAVDGREFGEKCHAWIARTPLSVGEAALTLSHRKIWRALLASADTHAIVLEDDVRLGEGFAELVQRDWSRFDFDIVKIETMFDKVWLSRRGETLGARALYRLGGEHHGAAGYVISREGARRALAASRAFKLPIDVVILGRGAIERGAIRAWQLWPAAVVQEHLAPNADPANIPPSTLESARGEKGSQLRMGRPKGLARAAREARRLFERFHRWARLSPTMSRRTPPFA